MRRIVAATVFGAYSGLGMAVGYLAVQVIRRWWLGR